MRHENLPSPGTVNGAQALRVQAARAISYHEIQADRNGGTPASGAEDLRAFFQACANAVPAAPEAPPEEA